MRFKMRGTISGLWKWIACGLILCLVAGALIALLKQESTESLLQRGADAVVHGDLETVREIVESLKSADSGQHSALVLSGWLAMGEGDYKRALQLLTPDMAHGPHRLRILVSIAECQYRTRMTSDAARLLERTVREYPESAHAHRLLAGIAYDLGDTDVALAELSHLARLDPDDFAAGHLAGTIYTDFSQHDLAIKALRKSLGCNPPEPVRGQIGRLLAENLIHVLDFDAALKTLGTLRSNPERDVLQAECQWKLGQKNPALETLDRLAQLPIRSPRLNWVAARVLWSERRDDRAVSLLKSLLDDDPWHVEGRYLLSQILESQGLSTIASEERAWYEEAHAARTRLTELNQQAAKSPHDAQVCDELAKLCEQMGRSRLAFVWRQAASNRRDLKRPQANTSSRGSHAAVDSQD